MNEVGILYDKMFALFLTNRARAIRYGFWQKWTFTFAGAQENENKFLAEVAKITTGEKILDAGCGVGGSSFWLAKYFQAKVTGVALGRKEIAFAKKLAIRKQLTTLVNFQNMDMVKTDFARGAFDVVWAIESILYVNEKAALFHEWARVLRPNGRVAIADLFLTRVPKTEKEMLLYTNFASHQLIAPLLHVDEVTKLLLSSGFRDIVYVDKRKAVIITSYLYMLNAGIFLPFVKVLNVVLLGKFPRALSDNIYMAIEQWRAIKSGLFTYGVFVATKK